MKNLKYKCLSIVSCFLLLTPAFGQGIRKHYTEVTEEERVAYRNAIDALISSGVIDQYADYHADPNQDGTDENSVNSGDDSQIHVDEEFLPWHRQFIWEFEKELQSINDYLTIPYWDWTGNSDPNGIDSRSTTGPLWANNQISALSWNSNFLGSYDATLNLNRELGVGATLPTSSEVTSVMNQTNFTTFRQQLEGPTNQNLHGRPHIWVGAVPVVSGSMSDILRSPRDPVFYFHHAMVDKLWQDWTEMGRTTTFSDSDMPTFDGTVSGFPYVNPSSIIDSKDLGIFYTDAVAQSVTLSSYSITNNFRPIEKFVYEHEIIAEDAFVVPNSTSARILSNSNIILKTGFRAESGSQFLARIGNIDFSSGSRIASNNTLVAVRKTGFESKMSDHDLLYPNPSNGNFEIEVAKFRKMGYSDYYNRESFEENVISRYDPQLNIYDLNGKIVFSKKLAEETNGKIRVNTNLNPGAYIVQINAGDQHYSSKLFIK